MKKQDDDRGAKIIALAVEIMKRGARGWSDALSQAAKQVNNEHR